MAVSSRRDYRWSAVQLVVLALVLAMGFVLGWRGRIPEITIGGDDATYIALSHSIEQGHYRDDFLYGRPAHVRYPPAFPVLILAARAVAGPALDVIAATNLILVLLAALLIADALRLLGQRTMGIAAAALIAWNPAMLLEATMVLSEPLFCFSTAAALNAALRSRQQSSGVWFPLASGFSVLSFAARSAGIASIAAVGGWLALSRQWKRLLVFACVSGAAVALWFCYVALATSNSGGGTYGTDMATGGAASPGLFSHAVSNFIFYLTIGLPWFLNLPGLPGTLLDNLAWLLLLLTVGIPGFMVLWRRWQPTALFLVFTLGLLLIWPLPTERLALPAFPFFAAMLLLGAVEVGRVVFRNGSVAGLALASLLAGLSLPVQFGRLREAAACGTGNYFTSAACAREESRGLVAAAMYIRDSLPASVVIATAKPATINYFSGRSTIRLGDHPFGARPIDSAATHVLLSRLVDREREVAAPSLHARCDDFSVVSSFDGMTLLLHVRRPGDGLEDACDDLAAFIRGSGDGANRGSPTS